VDAEKVKELFDYDPETGILRWRVSIGSRGKGSVAGTPSSDGRYLAVRYKGKYYQVSRLAFLWMIGRWPEPEADHQNLDKLDNRWCNLREATKSQNAANRAALHTNKVGFKGVIRVTRYGVTKYEARIRVNGRQQHLGRFDTAQEAHQAYVIAAEAAHGNFARS
jgi:hypothetical protein